MDMIKIHAGKIRAIGYDISKRSLVVEFENGSALAYAGIGESIWQNFKNSGNQWSFYRDNIEEEYTGRPVSTKQSSVKKNPLDDLFK